VLLVRAEAVAARHGRCLRDINNGHRHGTKVVTKYVARGDLLAGGEPGEAQRMLWVKEIRFRPKGRVGDRGRAGSDCASCRCVGFYRLLCGVVRVLARGGGERELEIVVLRH
jgi:hypothetical protein